MVCKAVAFGFIVPPAAAEGKQHQKGSSATKYNKLLSVLLPKKLKQHIAVNTTKQATVYKNNISNNVTVEEDEDGVVTSGILNSNSSKRRQKWKRNHRAYLCTFGNWFDAVSIFSYWADVILSVYEYPNLSLFKALGAMRPIRLLSMLRGTAVILRSLETSWQLILAVAGLILFFLVIFALLGLISFQGVFARRCYFTAEDSSLQLVEPPLYCAGYYNNTLITGPYNIRTGDNEAPGTYGYICRDGQVCIQDPANNPEYGFVNFDNFFNSFLSVYTTMSLELWTDLMYQTQEGESSISALYYCLVVYIVAFVLSFLLFAVVTSAFARVRAESAMSAFTARKKGYSLLRMADGLDDEEAMWMFDNSPDEFGKGVTRLRLRWWIVRLVKNRAFFYFGGLLVLLDLIIMCFRSSYASTYTMELVDNAETAFTFIFALEIVLRMVGATSWLAFWSSRRNLFDLSIVIVTCIIQLPIIKDSYAYKYLTIFQILRVYRLFICIPRVRRLLSAALGSGESVLYVMVFLILATAFCATVFMQMFGGDYFDILALDDPQPRFDTFWEAFVSLIVVYTSEKWTDLLYDAMFSQTGQGSIYAAVAISLYFAFGRYIMSGLYIAVVLENFELNDDYIRHYQIKDFIHRHRYKDKNRAETILLRLFRPLYHYNEKKNIQVRQLPNNLTVPLSKANLEEILVDSPKMNVDNEVSKPSWFEKKLAPLYATLIKKIPFMKEKGSVKTAPINPFSHDIDETPEDYDIVTAEENRAAIDQSKPVVNSLFFFSEHNQFRYYCKKLVGSSRHGQAEKRNFFNWFVMICVFVSILMVILDEPSTRLLRQDTSKQDVYDMIELILSVIFVIEVSIRIIADGLLLTPNAYLRNHWNQLDLCVILLNIGTIFMSTEEVPRGIGTFRSLRILRLIRYFNGVREIFVSLFYAFPLMFDALVFTALVLLPFAIYGVNLFGGLMWTCNDESVSNRSECIGEFTVDIGALNDLTILVPRAWQNPQNGFISFDDFPHALQHLFSLTSTEGWVDSMFSAMSTPMDPDIQPVFDWRSRTIYHGIFYIIFMIISQGTIQLFVGVIIEKFKERNGITTLTTAQRQYSDLQRLLASIRPTIKVFRPKSKIRQICYDLVKEKNGKFNRLMMVLYCLVMVAFRLGEGVDALQTLYNTIAKSAPSIIQVSAVFMVSMCLFAMLFMEFFGLTKYGIYGNAHANFRNYGNALLMLIRATTGEAWNAIIVDYSVQFPNCNKSDDFFETDCGSPFWSYFLFDMFYIVCTHIFLNLFTAVIISNFEYTYETRTRFTKITKSDLRMFKEAWADIDPNGTGYIQKNDVVALLRKLTGPFRIQIYDDRHSISNILKVGKADTTNFRTSMNDFQSPDSYYELAEFSAAREFNLPEINKLLQKMDRDEVRRRRVEFNLYYKEILRSETAKGIPFASVLTILSYRFIDISASLKLDPLIARLEQIEQLTQEYHIEKAAGFFLTQVQKRRFVRELWKKRDEDEVQKLGITNPSQFEFDKQQYDMTNANSDIVNNITTITPLTMVPRIVIDNAHVNPDTSSDTPMLSTAGTLTIPPLSPLSAISMDSQYNAYSPGGTSLIVASGTPNTSPSPIDSSSQNASASTLSPESLIPFTSPTSKNNWLLIDGNADMPSELSDSLLNIIDQSVWSGKYN
ncbi:Ion transport protein-domain-containing protein [Mycotypha africana]|uniref:Ion transport protein-domain-containing protein n=1 Tax=Mycotypha africana TaxID=64632 RepID=UPI002301DA81|nr:Ion transport protein-domain-containing protein [Mycotypha africana]KAI8977429.1 Ion transport protein-domain-containing protein [Mycotypha africana]